MKTTKNAPRRVSALIGAVLAAALVLSGCGSGSSSDDAKNASSSASASSSELLPAAEGKTHYPVKLETPWGNGTLDERPERVATVGAQAVDTELVLSLGATPVTTISNGFKQAPWSQDAAGGRIENVLDVEKAGDFPYEAIAAAHPDVIVVFGYDLTDSYQKLSAIAPVIANSDVKDGGKWSGDWKSFMGTLGNALDLQDKAARVVSDYDAKLQDVKSENPEFTGKTASFNVYYGDKYGLDYQSVPKSRPAGILTGIGFTLPAEAAEFAKESTVSDELMSKINADVVIVQDVSSSMDKSYSIDDLTKKPTFQRVPAVKDGHLVISPAENLAVGWAMSTGGPLGTSYALDKLVPLIAQKVG